MNKIDIKEAIINNIGKRKNIENQLDELLKLAKEFGSHLPRFCCNSCFSFLEGYMIHDELWLSIMPTNKGILCFNCLEDRLGRKLTIEDYSPALINIPIFFAYVMAQRENKC